MSVTRLFYPHPLTLDQPIILDKASSHYLTHVLRAKTGQPIVLFNGQGGEYHGAITALQKRMATLQLHEYITQDRQSPCKITLLQCLSRNDRMDMSIQKSTELGVDTIIPIHSERSAKLAKPATKLPHWQKIIISACEQSGRNRLPAIHTPRPLAHALTLPFCHRVFLHTHSHNAFAPQITAQGDMALLIGAEGGFSKQEQAMIIAHDFQALRLGPRVLRTETACIAALSILQYQWGDLGVN